MKLSKRQTVIAGLILAILVLTYVYVSIRRLSTPAPAPDPDDPVPNPDGPIPDPNHHIPLSQNFAVQAAISGNFGGMSASETDRNNLIYNGVGVAPDGVDIPKTYFQASRVRGMNSIYRIGLDSGNGIDYDTGMLLTVVASGFSQPIILYYFKFPVTGTLILDRQDLVDNGQGIGIYYNVDTRTVTNVTSVAYSGVTTGP